MKATVAKRGDLDFHFIPLKVGLEYLQRARSLAVSFPADVANDKEENIHLNLILDNLDTSFPILIQSTDISLKKYLIIYLFSWELLCFG